MKLRLPDEQELLGPEAAASSRWPLGVSVPIRGSGGRERERERVNQLEQTIRAINAACEFVCGFCQLEKEVYASMNSGLVSSAAAAHSHRSGLLFNPSGPPAGSR